jgi:hypothetical protein
MNTTERKHLLVVLLAVEGILILFNGCHWISKGWAVLYALAAVVLYFCVLLLGFILSLLFRWRFQFSIRFLLVLMFAVAVPCSWLAFEMKAARKQGIIDEEIEIRKYKSTHGGNTIGLHTSSYVANTYGAPLEFRLRLLLKSQLGDNFFWDITSEVVGSSCDDSLLELLQDVTTLEYLDISKSDISDAGLEHISRLRKLETLVLCDTRITDAGLEHLKGLTKLKVLYLRGTQVTKPGVTKLQQSLPRCHIPWVEN